ncbi:tyrosine-type recombinase/integrase [Mediterraneibacter sp. NSJ-55]|uniref:Tyrosine-type recombinase/integrase n=1 Tax=Mediterraneibacter hominis TaxID=2763054 RepID=A0A923RQ20_9FIRM|nr:tyrosine-type recombinase/integrase [Mediterraneibacter hominis]MBC5688203.1 tyrosine-type recombinase/integrase [Mediterraneibacter hominis]
MAERSKRIKLYDSDKVKDINPETLKLFQKYQIDMSIRDLSENSIKQYNSDLMQWFIYMHDNQFNLSVLEATDEDIEEYYYFRKQQGNNVNRQKRIMSSISAFYKFLRKKKIIKESPVEFIDRPKQGQSVVKQTFLTLDQVSMLREKLIEYGDIQLITYIFFGLSTMARVNAMAHLRWEQINFDERMCIDVLEKEGKIVDLYFSEQVSELLQKLKQFRSDNNINDYGWVFITPYVTEEKCISNGTLNDWCKKAGEMIGIPTLHNHDLRHSGSNILKELGMEVEDIAELLHHESTETTIKHYLTKNKKKIKENKDKFSF